MCGIAGYIAKKKDKHLAVYVNGMLDTIIHRGPDAEGKFFYKERIGLGHRRLSIIDLTDGGKQPMCFKDRWWITYNGEIYNYIELREELKGLKYTFQTQTDTEVVLAAYAEWGDKCVDHFNGMWSFAIFDKERERIFMSRDRFGVKPLYYYYDDEKFIFGSEIKEILSIKSVERRANLDTLSAFLVIGCMDYGSGTMFDNIYQLVGGHNLYLDCNTMDVSIKRYYDIRKVKRNQNTFEENSKHFENSFLKSVEYRLRSDVNVGSCLSGGLDSSSIVCAVNKLLKRNGTINKQCTVSSCFDDPKFDEQEYINSVVSKTGVKSYKVFPDMSKCYETLDKMIWHMDEPFGSTSIYAQWCVFEEAKRNGLTVMLDGQGADEQLAGYTPFYQVLFIDLIRQKKWKELRKELYSYKHLRSDFEAVSYYKLLSSTIISAIIPNKWKCFISAFVKYVKGMPFSLRMCLNEDVKLFYKVYDMRSPQGYIYGSMQHGMRALFHYEDRNSMAHSIESRIPFVDYELAEFMYSVPFDQKIKDGLTKLMIREGLRDMLPASICNRVNKLAFETPESKWLKDNKTLFHQEFLKACDVLEKVIDKKRALKWYEKNLETVGRGESTWFRIICAAHWIKIYNVKV